MSHFLRHQNYTLISLLFASGLLNFPIVATAAKANGGWTIGVEREIEPGTYAALDSVVGNWRIWRFDLKGEIFCRATSPAIGRSPSTPIGVGVNLWANNGTPAIEVDSANKYTPARVSLRGRYQSGGGEIRVVGDRYFSNWPKTIEEFSDFSGKSIEVRQQTWEYPAIHVGLVDETGFFILNEFNQMLTNLSSCANRSAKSSN